MSEPPESMQELKQTEESLEQDYLQSDVKAARLACIAHIIMDKLLEMETNSKSYHTLQTKLCEINDQHNNICQNSLNLYDRIVNIKNRLEHFSRIENNIEHEPRVQMFDSDQCKVTTYKDGQRFAEYNMSEKNKDICISELLK